MNVFIQLLSRLTEICGMQFFLKTGHCFICKCNIKCIQGFYWVFKKLFLQLR